MTAAGGALIIGIAVNMLGLGRERIKVGNMLPAMFLPGVRQWPRQHSPVLPRQVGGTP